MENKKRNKIVPDRVVDKNIITRTIIIANYMLENKATFREASEFFKVGLHTIHTDIHTLLPQIDKDLYDKLCEQFKRKLDERNSKISERFKEKAKEKANNKTDVKSYALRVNSKPVMYIGGEEPVVFKSISEASRETGYSVLAVRNHCRNNVKNPIFKFI